MAVAEEYLKPEVIRTVSRLDLRAKFIVEGFLTGLHSSPFHGFSVQFSEHRRYEQGDDPRNIDWLVYAKTDRYYVKKFEAETNLTGYLVLDSSESMGYTYRQTLNKFDYSVCLAAAMGYLMISQQDPVGLMTFDTTLKACLPARSRRGQLPELLAHLSKAKPTGKTDVAAAITRLAAMLRQRSLVMIFSDLLCDPEPVTRALQLLRHAGHDIILFHVLDEAEAHFPFDGMVEFVDPEDAATLTADASALKRDYLKAVEELRANYRLQSVRLGADYVPLDTSQSFDKALYEFLIRRQARC